MADGDEQHAASAPFMQATEETIEYTRKVGKRQCIKCHQDLDRRTIVEVEVDFCSGCRGLWLDEGEIRRLAEDSAAALSRLEEVERQVAALAGPVAAPADADLATPCPACGGKLTVAVFGPTSIELCSACHGIFLDHGELEKAIALVEGDEATTIVALARSVTTSGSVGA